MFRRFSSTFFSPILPGKAKKVKTKKPVKNGPSASGIDHQYLDLHMAAHDRHCRGFAQDIGRGTHLVLKWPLII